MTTISAPVTINAPDKDVVFDGIDFTKAGFIDLQNAKSFTMKNCRIFDLEPRKSKDFFLYAPNMLPCKVVIENCYFGPNPTINDNRLYNLLEINSLVSSGTSISNNYFEKDCCTHNAINFYGVEPDAVIRVEGNVFNYWNFCTRLGMKGEPKCKIMFNDNKGTFINAGAPETIPQFDSIILVQPYNTSTSTFKNVTLEINNLTFTDYIYPIENVVIAYCSGKDTQLEESDLPKTTMDGQEYVMPLYKA